MEELWRLLLSLRLSPAHPLPTSRTSASSEPYQTAQDSGRDRLLLPAQTGPCSPTRGLPSGLSSSSLTRSVLEATAFFPCC